MKILVTGGAGHIRSHTCVELLNEGYEVVVLDNLCNSSEKSLKRVRNITGKFLNFSPYDLRNKTDTATIFEKHRIEDFPVSTTNLYGRTKLMIEEILKDLYFSDNAWNIAVLRYFNPVGAYESGKIGEDPNGIPKNLMPYIPEVAIGSLPVLNVSGDDYDAPDGTGVRDYIHVVDLVPDHIRTLPKLFSKPGVVTYNLGTGQGYSVLERIRAFEMASGRSVPYQITERKSGDIVA